MDRPDRLVMSVTEAAKLLGISRTLAYELVARHELPSLRLGGRIVILTRPLLRLLDGLPADDGATSRPSEEPAWWPRVS